MLYDISLFCPLLHLAEGEGKVASLECGIDGSGKFSGASRSSAAGGNESQAGADLVSKLLMNPGEEKLSYFRRIDRHAEGRMRDLDMQNPFADKGRRAVFCIDRSGNLKPASLNLCNGQF